MTAKRYKSCDFNWGLSDPKNQQSASLFGSLQIKTLPHSDANNGDNNTTVRYNGHKLAFLDLCPDNSTCCFVVTKVNMCVC